MKFLAIALFLLSKSTLSDELVIKCQDNYTYRISTTNLNKNSLFYKYADENWKELEEYKIVGDAVELFIPGLKYLQCSDNNLPVCSYSKLIKSYKSKPSVSEIVLNDCFIGTMGCNQYKKGLMLNKYHCELN